MGYIDTIHSKNWQLYDITGEQIPDDWEGREARGPVVDLEPERQYLFTPIPQEGQTLWDAYAAVKGVGPCLRIEDSEDPRYVDRRLRYSHTFALFSRMTIRQAGVLLYMPTPPGVSETDLLLLRPDVAEETFTQQFDIITLSEVMQAAHRARGGGNPN